MSTENTENTTREQLTREMCRAQRLAGEPSARHIARHNLVSHSTISRALAGTGKLPHGRTISAFLDGIGANDAVRERVWAAWYRAKEEINPVGLKLDPDEDGTDIGTTGDSPWTTRDTSVVKDAPRAPLRPRIIHADRRSMGTDRSPARGGPGTGAGPWRAVG